MNILIAVGTVLSEAIIAHEDLALLLKTEVHSMHQKQFEDPCTQTELHSQVATKHESRGTQSCRQEIQIEDKFQKSRNKFLKFMKELNTMCYFHLQGVNIAKHCI